MANHRSPSWFWLLVVLRCTFCNADDPIPVHLLCALQHFDYFNLTAVTWVLSLDQNICLPLSPTNASEPKTDCQIKIGFCQSLALPAPCETSSVCQQSNKGFLNLGAYSENPFSDQVPLPRGAAGFYSHFPPGSAYISKSNKSCTLQTSIAFQCNHSAYWSVPHFSPQQPVAAPLPNNIHYNDSNCQLDLTFNYAGACRIKEKQGHFIGVGTVLIIIFFITLFLYLALGAMLNAVRGHSGTELIPHAQFWSSLPGYVKDGCLFACFCTKRSASDSYSQI